MNNVSNIKLNVLLEKLYIESTVNKLYEDISEFDWIDNSNPSVKDPKLTFNDLEYWVDISNLSFEDKNKVREYIKMVIDINLSHCEDFLDDRKLRELNGIVVHCGSDNTHFEPQENLICCMTSYFDDDEYNTDSVYIDGSEIVHLYNHKTLTENYILSENVEKNLYKKIIEDLGLTRKLIFTFSTGIAAMLGPVTSLLEGSGVNLNTNQVIMLIISGIAYSIGETDNKVMINKLKEEGIYQYLMDVVDFITNIKKLVDTVLDKTLKGLHGLTEILGFTFIMIPVMKILSELIDSYNLNFDSLGQLFAGLIGGSVSYGVKNIIDKIRKRLN